MEAVIPTANVSDELFNKMNRVVYLDGHSFGWSFLGAISLCISVALAVFVGVKLFLRKKNSLALQVQPCASSLRLSQVKSQPIVDQANASLVIADLNQAMRKVHSNASIVSSERVNTDAFPTPPSFTNSVCKASPQNPFGSTSNIYSTPLLLPSLTLTESVLFSSSDSASVSFVPVENTQANSASIIPESVRNKAIIVCFCKTFAKR